MASELTVGFVVILYKGKRCILNRFIEQTYEIGVGLARRQNQPRLLVCLCLATSNIIDRGQSASRNSE